METSTVTVHLESGEAFTIRPLQILAIEDVPEAGPPNCNAKVVLTNTDPNGENVTFYVRETVRTVVMQLTKLPEVVTVARPDFPLT